MMRTRLLFVWAVLAAGAAVILAGADLARAGEIVVDQNHAKADDAGPGTAEAPFKTISKAVSAAVAGDTVTVKAGVYREEIHIPASGEAGKPITLRAAPGERVVVSGTDPVTGWRKVTREEARGNPNWEKLRVAEIGWKTRAVFQDGRPLPLSRFPKVSKTKLPAQGGDETRLVDAAHLTQPAGFWEGGMLTVRDASTTNYDSGTITGYDPEKHELLVDKPRRVAVEAGKDEYYVKNLVSIITQPGEWAIDTSVAPHRLYVWPLGDADPNALLIEAGCRGRRRLVSWADGAGHLVIEGLEIAQGLDAGIGGWGDDKNRGHDVLLDRCIVRHCLGKGVEAGFQDRLKVRHSIVACNGSNGVSLAYVRQCSVEENLVFSNGVDAIVFGWYSRDNRAVRNCVYDQWSMSHPDGFQTFRNVDNLLVSDNLFLNVGQGWQCSTTHGIELTGNMFVGTRGGTLNFTPRDYRKGDVYFAANAKVAVMNNTLAYNGINNVTILDTFMVVNNVMEPGGWTQKDGHWRRDWNLYIDYKGPAEPRPFGRKVGGGKFAETNDAHSKVARPKFRNAPEAVYKINDKKFSECTPAKLHLAMSPGDFAVGDHVELNWDGRARKVTEVGAGYIVFDPPLEFVHPYGWDVVGNWRANEDFALDLRLAEDSPGRGMGEGGKDVGSKIDIQAYLRGDFDGNGTRDVPPVVDVLKHAVRTWDE